MGESIIVVEVKDKILERLTQQTKELTLESLWEIFKDEDFDTTLYPAMIQLEFEGKIVLVRNQDGGILSLHLPLPTSPVSPKKLDLERRDEKQYHVAIGTIFLLISFGAFYLGSTEPSFQLFIIELYYIPVIIAAIAFGWKWGLFYALAASIASLMALYGLEPYTFRWLNYLSFATLSRSALFIFIGVTTGYLSKREKQRQQIYQKISQTIEIMPNPVFAKSAQEWFDQVLEAVDAMLHPKTIDIFSVMLLAEDGDYLRIRAARGLSDEVLRTTRHPVGKGFVGRVMKSGKPLLCRDLADISLTQELSGLDHKVVSALCVPVISEGKTLGVIMAASYSKTHPFDEMDLTLLAILTRAVAANIAIADLQKGLKEIYLQTIHSLSGTINIKDSYTHDHSEKIAQYALAIATRLNFTNAEKQDLYVAALLHDIGKIGISDAILLKRDRLTPQEYEEVKKHPVLGMRILEGLEQMKGVAKLVLYHHEKFDGTGYPDGLKELQIPMGSRILSVVDAYDAMTSDRVYRKAMSVEQAIEELERNKGKQFDPNIIDIFLEIIKNQKPLASRI